MTTCAMDLLEHPDFVAFCLFWRDQYRIPIGLPDWLREQGLEQQAKAADWCLTEPDRREFSNFDREGGPTPKGNDTNGYWWWFRDSWCLMDANDLPFPLIDALLPNYKTFPEAIAVLLDNFKPEAVCAS